MPGTIQLAIPTGKEWACSPRSLDNRSANSILRRCWSISIFSKRTSPKWRATSEERGANWRPHSKANKSPVIGHRELRAGAIGITCAKLGEAEVLVASGIFDILISNQIVGPIKTRRLAWINRQDGVDVKCCVDSLVNVQEIMKLIREAGVNVRVLIEINSGMERAGVLPQNALALAKEIHALEGIELAGLMTWEGHAMAYTDFEERSEVVKRSIALVLDAGRDRGGGYPGQDRFGRRHRHLPDFGGD
ncbi:MAG: alanine racemase [Thermomicrobiales bacterium]